VTGESQAEVPCSISAQRSQGLLSCLDRDELNPRRLMNQGPHDRLGTPSTNSQLHPHPVTVRMTLAPLWAEKHRAGGNIVPIPSSAVHTQSPLCSVGQIASECTGSGPEVSWGAWMGARECQLLAVHLKWGEQLSRGTAGPTAADQCRKQVPVAPSHQPALVQLPLCLSVSTLLLLTSLNFQ
jgi:hypothetical protein